MPTSKTSLVGNLPALLSSIIGRTREIEEVKAAISAHHLVTLTGAGGCRKSRLAYKVADEMTREFENGVWVVELPLTTAKTIRTTVGTSTQFFPAHYHED